MTTLNMLTEIRWITLIRLLPSKTLEKFAFFKYREHRLGGIARIVLIKAEINHWQLFLKNKITVRKNETQGTQSLTRINNRKSNMP